MTRTHGAINGTLICYYPDTCKICNLTQKDVNMEFNPFVRKPFTVDAIEVTAENIEELAPLVGTLRHKDNGAPYIQVDRRLVPNIYRVYPGFWITKMGDNVRCYSKRIFTEQFVPTNNQIQDWVDFLNGPKEEAVANG